MVDNEKKEILKAREYIVKKSNQMVQKSRYNFSVQEQKTIAYICSKIKQTNYTDKSLSPFQLEYEFSISDYCKVCGIQSDGGRQYEEMKSTLKGLSDKSMWLQQENGSEVLVRWLAKAITDKGDGKVIIKIDEDLAPYLFDLKSRFLSYGLKNILNMKSQYSIRLYELLKSYHDLKIGQTDHRDPFEKKKNPKMITWILDLDELKRLLMVENQKSYNNFAEFKRRVLEPAEKEINELTDINISYEPIHKGKKVVKIQFSIIDKKTKERLRADHLNNELLGDDF